MVPIDGTILVDHWVFVLGGDQKVFDGSATFEVSLDAISTTDLFDTFTKTLCVGYDNVTLTLHSMVGRLGTVVAPIIDLEYITAIEAACTKLSQQDAEELRADINRVLRSSHPSNPT